MLHEVMLALGQGVPVLGIPRQGDLLGGPSGVLGTDASTIGSPTEPATAPAASNSSGGVAGGVLGIDVSSGVVGIVSIPEAASSGGVTGGLTGGVHGIDASSGVVGSGHPRGERERGRANSSVTSSMYSNSKPTLPCGNLAPCHGSRELWLAMAERYGNG